MRWSSVHLVGASAKAPSSQRPRARTVPLHLHVACYVYCSRWGVRSVQPLAQTCGAESSSSVLHARSVEPAAVLTRSMKASARELALCVPAVVPSVDPHARSDPCLSPPILSPSPPCRPPEPDAAIRLGPKFQVSTVPVYQGSSCTDACERGDRLLSLAEVELALARTTACRITAAAFHEPGVRLDLVKGEWLSVPRRRRQQPRCRTFGCSLPDLHAGLHQVPRAPPAPPLHPPQKSLIARTPLAGGQPGLQAAGGTETLA